MGVPPRMPPPDRSSRAYWKAERQRLKRQARMERESWRAQARRGGPGSVARGSIIGPLLLVAIGTVALLITTHRLNVVRFWQWYGHWWPVILIAAGVVLALESMAMAGAARVRLGGGAVLLGILLALLGVAAAHREVNWPEVGDQLGVGDSFDMGQMFGDRHEATEQIAHPVSAGETVVIENPRGDVTIAAGGGDQMRLTLKKTVFDSSDKGAERRLRELEPLITSSANTTTVHLPPGQNDTADLEMTLPAGVAVEVRAGRGDISVEGRQAAVNVDAGHGDVRLSGITGPVRAAMHEGDLSASRIEGAVTLSGRMNDVTLDQVNGAAALDGDFFGDVHLRKIGGAVHLHSSRTEVQLARLDGSLALDGEDLAVENPAGPVAVATHAKEVTLRRVSGEVRLRNDDGAVTVKAANPVGAMTIENRNSSVEISLPAAAAFSVDAKANNGEVHSDFGLAAQNSYDHGTLLGQVNGGGPLLRITTEKGDITLNKQ